MKCPFGIITDTLVISWRSVIFEAETTWRPPCAPVVHLPSTTWREHQVLAVWNNIRPLSHLGLPNADTFRQTVWKSHIHLHPPTSSERFEYWEAVRLPVERQVFQNSNFCFKAQVLSLTTNVSAVDLGGTGSLYHFWEHVHQMPRSQ